MTQSSLRLCSANLFSLFFKARLVCYYVLGYNRPESYLVQQAQVFGCFQEIPTLSIILIKHVPIYQI